MTADDFDFLVLGGGSAGIAAAVRAARHGARVAVLEPNRLGGTCVNVGCVPKKAMWYAAELAEAQRLAADYGFALTSGTLDWPTFVARREAYIDRARAAYTRRFAELGITLVPHAGRFVAPRLIEAGDRRLQAPHVVIATGARSRDPTVPGGELGFGSDGFFALRACPRRVAVIGGGYVAVELAGVLRALGAEVELFARHRLLAGFDREIADALAERMQADGIRVHFNAEVAVASGRADGVTLDLRDGTCTSGFDALLWAIGRVPNVEALGLEVAGVALDGSGHIATDAYESTRAAGVYAVGDVAGKRALTPVAIAAARRLADRLFGGRPEARLDYDDVPTVVFAHPPIGTVGLSEEAARERHGDDAVRVYRARFTPMQLALSDHPRQSLMKLVCVGTEERVAGVHVFGPGADEMLQGFAVAVRMGARMADLDATVAIHPTSAEELVLMR